MVEMIPRWENFPFHQAYNSSRNLLWIAKANSGEECLHGDSVLKLFKAFLLSLLGFSNRILTFFCSLFRSHFNSNENKRSFFLLSEKAATLLL